MIIRLLLFSTLEFATNVLGAFVFFSAGMLFWDAWKVNTSKYTPAMRSIGCWLLSVVYVVYATSVNIPWVELGTQVVKIFALALILISVLHEPILEKPKKAVVAMVPLMFFSYVTHLLVPLSSVLLLLISIMYWRRATEGIDRQLKSVAISFFLFAIAEYIKSLFAWANTTNAFWSQALMKYAIVWDMYTLCQIFGLFIFGAWVWGYIRFRLQIQVFVSILTSTLLIFLSITVFFSYQLLHNIEQNELNRLRTDANVFQYALDRLQLESLSLVNTIASRDSIRQAFKSGDADTLYRTTAELLVSLNLNSLVSVDSSGEVLMRAENRDNIGDTLIHNEIIVKALKGEGIGTLVADSQPINPNIIVTSAAPVVDTVTSRTLGALMMRTSVDNVFVDGIKSVTGLDATVYVGDTRTATTLVGPDGTSRYIGMLETQSTIRQAVLEQGRVYVGATDIMNEPYYAAYSPLRSYGGTIIGMLFVGRPQAELLSLAQEALAKTFLGSMLLIVVSIYPVFILARYMREHIEA